MTQPIVMYGGFDKSTNPVTGLTVTVNVYRITRSGGATSQIVTGGSATEIGDGLYLYAIVAADLQTYDYLAAFKTTGDVDKKTVWAVYPALANAYATELANLDAAVSTRLPTASYVAPLDATATQNAVTAALVAVDVVTSAELAVELAGIPDAILDDEEASAGVTIRQAIAASGSAADPLLNSLGSYPDDTGGGALQKINNIADAVLYGPAILDNTMELADASQGSLRPGQQLTWLDTSGVAVNLTGATLTGAIRSRKTGTARAITGTLTVTDATSGVFTWTYSEADVEDAGDFDVQFTAAYSAGATPAKTFVAAWRVRASIEVTP